MLGLIIDPWTALGLLAFAVVVTLTTNWLVARFRRPTLPRSISLADITTAMASLLWILLIFVAGLVTTRYIERIMNAAIGYLIFVLSAFLLSLVRALLYHPIQKRREQTGPLDRRALFRCLIHNSTYLLLAIILYLVLAWLLRRPADPLLFIPLCIGALLPDLDTQDSVLGRLLPFVARWLEDRLGHRQEWHSLAANAYVALITVPLAFLSRPEVWYVIPLGFLSHLVLDMLIPQGIMLFWPLTRTRYFIFGGFVKSPGSHVEGRLAAALALVAGILILVIDIGPPASPPASVLSYEQTVERYYTLRGRNLVFAYVEGTWQATGRRMRGWLEILNATDESFIMLDRYDREVFTAGRNADDNLYLNRITLQTGSSAHIKPAEIHLQDQRLAKALPVVYEMQREPGLQHIHVSGDIVVPTLQDVISPTLQVDYAQTSLRRIQAHEPGHYSLHFLTAGELIDLANLKVETADLVIVATYASPATEPTVTPLPSPPATPEPAP